eukprot:TRINITY_DN6348_c0_g1_i1.p1 TRINITY_DN6348_c0_g1~~TRINITY_DN6348_c0_g1_i1.p1  ORF type:complete len:191 (+),score=32.21 TRINITY_DN6348_c0_g1_i1:53-625(+)
MGNKNASRRDREHSQAFIVSGKVEQAIPDLQVDWARVKGKPPNKINWKKTTINKAEFAQLMDSSFSPSEVDGLFQLYDPNHDGSITWAEYICVISLILDGTLEEKIKLLFNCFDEDSNGELSKEEFRKAAEKFSTNTTSLTKFVDSVFSTCDINGDGKVTYSEFVAWQKSHPEDFQKFTGNLHILDMEGC